MRGKAPAAPRINRLSKRFEGRFPLFFQDRRRQPLNHLPSLSDPSRRDFHGLLTLGSGEPLRVRAWSWRFATEPAAREQKRHEGGLRLQSPPPSKSTTTTTTKMPEEQWRTSTPPSSPSSSPPRASPREWRDASSESELQRRRSWKKQSATKKVKKGKTEEGKNQEAIEERRQLRLFFALSLSQPRLS